MSQNINFWRERAALKALIREFFTAKHYLEIDTPIAVTCPGTEVHLQYFATQWVDYLAKPHPLYLRSSPELQMKRILAEGYEKIFQLGPCFRNGGELSDWHHPEFTMLEWYSVGQTYDGLIDETAELLRSTAEAMAVQGYSAGLAILPERFERIGVYDAFQEFAGVTLVDQDPDLARKCRDKGVLSVHLEDDFETAYFKTLIEKIEPEIASRKGVILKDYPPSQAALAAVENQRACRFEFYVGRIELCNGFFELTGESANRQRIGEAFSERKRIGLPSVPEDEDFYHALSKWSKPCAGNALGFDRWLALICGQSNLDAVLPLRRSGVFLL